MSDERAVAWAAEFARRLISQSSVNEAWSRLLSALSSIETEFANIFQAAGHPVPFMMIPGKDTAILKGPAERQLELWLSTSDGTIGVKNSWTQNTRYGFKANASAEIFSQVGAPYPGLDTSRAITPEDVAIALAKSIFPGIVNR